MEHDNHSSASDKVNVLVNTKYGYAISCSCCEYLQIGFGNVSIDQCPGEFQRFVEIIGGLVRKFAHCQAPPTLRSICLPTPFTGFNLLLSRQELEQLNEMLQTAVLIMKAENLAN